MKIQPTANSHAANREKMKNRVQGTGYRGQLIQNPQFNIQHFLFFFLLAIWLCGYVAIGYPVYAADFEGAPWYIAGKTRSSPLSDFGSHFGVKAYLDDDAFAGTVYYPALTGGMNGELDRSYLYLAGRKQNFLEKSEERRIGFTYFGWQEKAKDKNVEAEYRVVFLGTDVLYQSVAFKNKRKETMEVQPVLAFAVLPKTYVSEDMYFPKIPEINKTKDGVLLKTGKLFRAVHFQGAALKEIINKGASMELWFDKIILAPGETRLLSFIMSFTAPPEKEEEALDKISKTLSGVVINPFDAWSKAKQTWVSLFSSLAKPRFSGSEFLELQKLAATGLMMNLYAPRNKMTYYSAVPAKVHFNNFWGWDTPFHAMGLSTFNTQLAWEVPRIQFETQKADGMVYQILGDNLRKVSWDFSQPPVQGWALRTIYDSDPDADRKKRELEFYYPKFKAYLFWFEKNRDKNNNGLFEFLNPYEDGGDDTPRLLPEKTGLVPGLVDVTHIEAVDLTSWMYLNYKNMEYFAKALGLKDDEALWRKRREQLSKNIDAKLWSEKYGGWMEFDNKKNGQIDVLTPIMWFPAFAGVTKDLKKLNRVIREHILNPEEFFGDYPVPSVAYNSRYYNHKEDGTYWRGQIWVNLAFITAQTLFLYGYEKEAGEIAVRTLNMLTGKGGLYETYNAKTGDAGWSSKGRGYASAFQLGWSCAFTMLLLERAYEKTRFLLNRGEPAKEVEGFIRELYTFPKEELFFRIDAPYLNLPKVRLNSLDGKPLQICAKFTVIFSDPYGNTGGVKLRADFPQLKGFKVYVEDEAGKQAAVSLEKGSGVSFFLPSLGEKETKYLVVKI